MAWLFRSTYQGKTCVVAGVEMMVIVAINQKVPAGKDAASKSDLPSSGSKCSSNKTSRPDE